MKYYVLTIWGGIEPATVGPFGSVEEQRGAAKAIYETTDPANDTVLWLDVDEDGLVTTGAWDEQFLATA